MGLFNKLRRFVSPNTKQPAETNSSSPKTDPSLTHPQRSHVNAQDQFELHNQAIDPFDDLEDIPLKEGTPVLDDEWELYDPKSYNQASSDSDSALQQPKSPQAENDLDAFGLSSSVPQYNSSISQSSEHEFDQSSFDFDPSDPALSVSANLLPETEMISEIDPPNVFGENAKSSLSNPHEADHQQHDLGSVFIPSSRRTDRHAPPRLSLALVPVSVPNPLSYALVFRAEIERLQNLPEAEQHTNQLIDLFNQYTSLVPNDIHMWSMYSEILIELQGLEHAYNQVKMALGKTRDDTAHLLMLADMSRRMCDTHAAWHYISILNDLHPNNIEVLEQLRDIQRECKFFELAQNTDAHIQQLYQNQQSHIVPEHNFPLDTRD